MTSLHLHLSTTKQGFVPSVSTLNFKTLKNKIKKTKQNNSQIPKSQLNAFSFVTMVINSQLQRSSSNAFFFQESQHRNLPPAEVYNTRLKTNPCWDQ